MPGFYVLNLGCKVNRAESDTMAASCIAAGAERTPPEDADVAIVNTCTVTAEADAKTRKAIRRLSRKCSCPVIVTGCAAAIHGSELAGLGEHVVVEPARLKASQMAVDVLQRCGAGDVGDACLESEADPGAGAACDGRAPADGMMPGGDAECSVLAEGPAKDATDRAHDEGSAETATDDGSASSASDPNTPIAAFEASSPEAARVRATGGFKTRMDIKIQDGCPNSCTFCIVHIARGPMVSVDADDVVSQVESAACAGVGEVVLTGINLGCYRSRGLKLPGLIERLMQTGIGRVRISSIEPPHVDEELAGVMAEYGQRICAHLHVPLQSGCDRTLEAMGRLYDTAEFERRIAIVREARPELSLTTDVIVGFPGETDGDFEESLAFCRRIGFSKMHVFRYSRREGTPAATMEGQVPPETMSARSARMRELSDQMRLEDAESRVGGRERLLMMYPTVGMAQSYHEAVVDAPQEVGSFVDVTVTGADADGRLLASVGPLPDSEGTARATT